LCKQGTAKWPLYGVCVLATCVITILISLVGWNNSITAKPRVCVQAPGPSLEKAVLSIETDENGSAVLGSPDGKHFSIDSEDVGGNLDTFSVVNDKVLLDGWGADQRSGLGKLDSDISG